MLDANEAKRIAATYPVSASMTRGWERDAYFTPLQHYAWLLRFALDDADEYLAKLPLNERI